MHNTYINERMLENYPFRDGIQLPFPNSAIGCIKVCAGLGVSSIYVSRVSIAGDTVTVTLNGTLAGAMTALGTLTAKAGKSEGGESSCTVLYGGLLECHMSAGVIPAGCSGVYDGIFELDPGCISRIPQQARGKLTRVSDGTDTYGAGTVLSISTAGKLSASGATSSGASVTVSLSCSDMPGWLDTSVGIPERVTWLNGESTEGGKSLVIQANAPVSASMSSVGSGTSSSILVTLNGGRDFPNCYKAQYDDADIDDRMQPTSL